MSPDYLFGYPSEAAARADLADYVVDGQWSGAVLPDVRVYLAVEVRGPLDLETGEAELISPAVTLPGWWVWISTAEPDAGLLAREACRIAVDPDAAAAGEPFVLLVRDIETASQVVRIDPMPIARSFPYGNLVMIDEG